MNRQRSITSFEQDTVEPKELSRPRNGTQMTPGTAKRPKRISAMKPEIKFNPDQKEPFRVLPSKFKGSNLPKRMFMPKATNGNNFHWPGLIAPTYCLPEAYDSEVCICPIFTKKSVFVRPVTDTKDLSHSYPECRDRDLPSKPDQKGNPAIDYYLMNLFTKAAETEATDYIKCKEEKKKKQIIARDKSIEEKVASSQAVKST